MLGISQISTPDDIAAAAGLVQELTAWAFAQDPDAGSAPTFQDLDKELAGLPGIYGPPTGGFLLARYDGAPAGCVAFRARVQGEVELKRMYVRPDYRGRQIGETLVRALIDEVREQNVTRIVLDSYHTMTSAHRIYRNLGFRDVATPDDFPAFYKGRVIFMQMDLNQS